MIISYFPAATQNRIVLPFEYDGDYKAEVTNDGFKVSFLSSGTLKMKQTMDVTLFLVGGGGAGAKGVTNVVQSKTYGGGGGGGGSTTQSNKKLLPTKTYDIHVGAGGAHGNPVGGNGENSTFVASDNSISLSAEGGAGGGQGYDPSDQSGITNGGGNGGTGSGLGTNPAGTAGTGGTAFDGISYGGGGGGGSNTQTNAGVNGGGNSGNGPNSSGTDGTANTGGGGGGCYDVNSGYHAGDGGSGIVILKRR